MAVIGENIIFVHIPKNAGTSITNCIRIFNKKGSINYHVPWRISNNPEHITLGDLKEVFRLNKQIQRFDASFKFCVVRNPYDYVVTLYYWIKNRVDKRKNPIYRDVYSSNCFKEYMKYVYKTWKKYKIPYKSGPVLDFYISQCDYMESHTGVFIPNYVLRFEQLNKDWIEMVRKHQLPFGQLHKINSIRGSLRKHDYRSYYDQETISIVGDIYQKDIDRFKYKF